MTSEPPIQEAPITELTILYRDDHLIAINKPSGLLVHPSAIDKHETHFAMKILRNQIGHYVYPLHRLDKPTSGVLLFALHKQAAQITSKLFEAHQIHKTYHAIVRGYTDPSGIIDHPLKIQADTSFEEKHLKENKHQTALTYYERLNTVEIPAAIEKYSTSRYSLIQCRPETGRKHQIRRHCKHIHHPIIGDARYGRGRHNRFFQKTYHTNRLLLHASSLNFSHPVLRQPITIKAPFDANFHSIFNAFGWQRPVVT